MYLNDICTIPTNLAGHPAMSVPFGVGDDGLPVGVQVLAPALGDRTALRQLSPGVDVSRFHPGADGAAVRDRYGLGDAPVVVCVSRLVRRKGQDVLVEAWPRVLARHPSIGF